MELFSHFFQSPAGAAWRPKETICVCMCCKALTVNSTRISMSSDSETESQGGSHGMPEEAEEEWGDWEDDESSGVRCLLSDATFPTVEAALAHDCQQGFDLREYMRKESLGQYDVIKVINFFRSEAQAGRSALAALSGGARPWDADTYFQPVMPDDELLFHDWEEEEEQGAEGVAGTSSAAAAPAGSLAALQQENDALRSALQAMQAVLLQDGGLEELLGQQQAQGSSSSSEAPAATTGAEDGAGPSGSMAAATGDGDASASAAAKEEAERVDRSYFESYSFFDIHREMLGDKVRTEAYREALECNPSLMKGVNVLDVGCGTAILSMFAARGGAAAVVGVDGSEEIAKYARANCAANGLGAEQGGPVTVVTGRVESLQELPLPEAAGGKVDVLVSEWMGYALLFESMLDSVLAARDAFLRPGGAVLPDLANIYVAGGGIGTTGLNFWDSVYGFSMRPIQDSIRQSALQRALVRPVSASDLVTGPQCVKCLDLATMAPADQDFTAEFRLEAAPEAAGPQQCHSLVVWFDTVFSERFCRDHPVTLPTGPDTPQTHWVQTVLLLKEPIELCSPASAGQGGCSEAAVAIEGCISFARNKKRHRSLDIALQYSAVRGDGTKAPAEALIYAMGVADS